MGYTWEGHESMFQELVHAFEDTEAMFGKCMTCFFYSLCELAAGKEIV